MTYVINPIWFYIADLADSLIIMTCIVFVCVVLAIVLIFIALTEEQHNYTEMKYRRILVVVGVVLMLLVTVLPSKDTIYKMMIAKVVTYENIEKGDKYIEKRLDKIFDYIKDDEKKGNQDGKRN